MSALSVADKSYKALLDKFAAAVRGGEADNLKRYHSIGELFDTFAEGAERNTYGERTVDQLAEDLTERGLLVDIKDGKRFLYWARSIYEDYPDVDDLMTLAEQGFTVTHAKSLFVLDDEFRAKVVARLANPDGSIISTRELDAVIKEEARGKAVESIAKIATPKKEDASGFPPAEGEGEGPVAGTPVEEAKPAVKAEKEPAKKPASVARAEPMDIPHPLKTLASMEKLISRAITEVPDVLIVLKEVTKRGFDSDSAQKKFREHVANLKSALQAVIEPLQILLNETKDSEE